MNSQQHCIQRLASIRINKALINTNVYDEVCLPDALERQVFVGFFLC